MQTLKFDTRKLRERINLYEKLMRLDKPIGILLLLWPTLWALWLSAQGRPDWMVVWVFTLGTVLMRSAGCVINERAGRQECLPARSFVYGRAKGGIKRGTPSSAPRRCP